MNAPFLNTVYLRVCRHYISEMLNWLSIDTIVVVGSGGAKAVLTPLVVVVVGACVDCVVDCSVVDCITDDCNVVDCTFGCKVGVVTKF